MMKVLRALYLVACFTVASPIIFGWIAWMLVLGIIYAIRDEGTLREWFSETVVKPAKFAKWLYWNIIKHGNESSKYSYDEFTI